MAIGPANAGASPGGPGALGPARRPLFIPAASASLSVPAQVQIGSSFTFTATFDNTHPSDVGYGPFIDIVFPVIGADGAGAAVDDGVDFTSATYLGAAVTAVQLTFGTANTGGCSGGLGPVSHPYAIDNTNTPLLVCGTPGNKLVTLQLPFGSFTPDQPAAVVTLNATLSNLADAGTALTLRTRGGYQYGATPENDWCCGDVSIVSHPGTSTGWPGSSVTPTVLSLAKTYNGPEDETATGPNYARQYTVAVDIAAGQPISSLTINDTLPNNMQFISVVSTAPAATCTPPSTLTPGGTLSCSFGSVTGGAGASDASLTFSFFIPLDNSGGSPVINPTSGDDATSLNSSSVSGSWDPIDNRDPITAVSAGGVCPTGCHTLTDKSIAIQKSVSNVVDVGVSGNSPGDTLEYTLSFQISDFFSFEQVIATDVLSDGQRVDLAFTPTLQVNGNGYTLAAAAMNAANFTIDNSQIGNSGPNPPPDGTDGTQTIVLRVSDELVTRGESSNLIGGCIPVAGTGGPDPDCATTNDGATVGTIRFRTTIQQDFSDTYPSGDSSVDHGDLLTDDVSIAGDLLSVADNSTPTGGSDADGSAASLSIAFGALSKSVYAVNGTVCAPCTTEVTVNGVTPGDSVTFRLRYTQPSSDFEQTTLTDYLPLPIFDATEIGSFSNTPCGVPAAGNACLGPADTYHSLNGPPVNEPNPVVVPLMTTNATSNFVRFSYADYDSATNTSSEIDLLFTVTVSDLPFADGLFLTNQANATEGTTNAGDQALDAILQIKINEPLLIPTKSAVSTDATTGVTFNPAIGAPIVFDTPGVVEGTADWSGGVISSNYLAANPIDADLTGVDAGDLVKFAIVIENAGHSDDGAFDIAIQDAMPAQYEIPGSGLNLEVFLGDGVTSVAFTDLGGGLFGNGIQLVDPGVPAAGACQAHHPTSGENVVVITYDLQLSGSVALSQSIVNTSTLLSYAGTEGGPNHVPSGITDTVTVTPIATPVKAFIVTSEAHTSDAGAPPRVAIGEIARYRVVVGIPEGSVNNLRVRDNLPAGLLFLDDDVMAAFVSNDDGACTGPTVSSSTLGTSPWVCGAGAVIPVFVLPDEAVSATDSTSVANYAANDNDNYLSGAGTDVFFKLGNLTNDDRDADGEFVVIEFNALVENIAGNGSGTNRNNSATYRLNSSTTDSSGSNSVQVRTVQPSITFGKTIISLPAELDAGGGVAYRLTIANGTGVNLSTAFDVVVTDPLPSALTLNPLPGSVVVTTSGTVGAVDTSNTAVNTPPAIPSQLDVRIALMAPGSSVTIDYAVTINSSVTPNLAVANTGLATWTSLPGLNGTLGNPTGSNTPGNSGDANGERSGTGSSPNSYRATSAQSFTSATPAIAKLTPSPASAPIGATITYNLRVTLIEGTIQNLEVSDNPPAGLGYVSHEVITTAATSGGNLAADFDGTLNTTPACAGCTPGASGPLSFAFGTATATGDNDTTDNAFLVQVVAQALNVVGNQAGTGLTNTGDFTYTGKPAGSTASQQTVTVLEPSITLGKAIISLPGDLDAGGQVAYRITLANGTGANVSTAFDLVVADTLPTALTLDSLPGSVVVTTSGSVGAVDTSNTAVNSPPATPSQLDVRIGSMAAGSSVTIDYTATINSSVTPAEIIANVGNAIWSSLSGTVSGERSGADGPGGALDDYAATDTRNFTAADAGVSKQLVTTSAAHTSGSNVTIGEEITYAVLLTPPEGTTASDSVVDDLPSGLALVVGSAEVVTTASASGGLLAEDYNGTIGTQTIISVPGDGGSVTFSFTNLLTNTDNDTDNNAILLRFLARATDVAGNVGFPTATTLSNSATNQVGAGTPTASNTVAVTVVEPRPVISKTFTPASGSVNDVIRVTLSYQNTGTSNAYDLVIEDSLSDVKFSDITPVTTPAGFTFVADTSVPGVTTVRYTANAGTAVAPSATRTFEFDLTLTSSVVPGELLPNTADVTQTTTLDSSTVDGDDANERNSAASDSEDFSVTETDLSIDKSHVGNFTVDVNGTFTLSVRNVSAGAATGSITVTDSLPAELRLQSVSGTNWSCTPVLGPPDSFSCTHPGPIFGGSILPDIVLVVRPDTVTGSPFLNSASVAIVGTDSNPANNTDTDSVNVVSTNPDLAIVKTHSGNFTVGSQGSFNLTVTNQGAQATSGTITVTDTLPPELDYVFANGTGWACAHTAGVVTCTHPGPLFPSASLPVITLSMVPNTATGSPFVNNASVSTSGDTNPGNDDDSDSVVVNAGPAPDLTIAKTHTGNFTVGVNGTFTLTVTNVGAAGTLATIAVSDTLPAELAFVSAAGTGWTCSNIGQAVSCTHPGPLGVGASLPGITLTVNPNTAVGSPFSNAAAVATPGDGNPANDSSTDSVIVTPGSAPDLAVTKTHVGNFSVGSDGSFSITVTNIGSGATTAPISLSDTLVAELTFVSASGTGWDCSASVGQDVSCTHPGPVASGSSLPVLTVTVNPTTAVGSPFSNTASVSTAGDSNPGNDSDSDSVAVDTAPAPDLTIAKTHAGNFTLGVNNGFALVVSNVGSGTTSGPVTVSDSVPAGLTFVSVSGTGWDCSATVAPNISCTHPGPLAAGNALPALTLTVTPTATTPPAITNTATVNTAGDTNVANDSDSDNVQVVAGAAPDLTIVKSHLSNFVVGVNGVYTFSVSNVGSAATTGSISVTDTLQTGLAFVSASSADANWDCSGSAGVNVSCSHPGPLGAGAALANLQITVSVGAAAIGTFNNVATVSTPGDSDSSNDSDSDSTTVTATSQPDLAISKSHTGSFAIGTTGTYTVGVSNVGSAATSGAISVVDTLQTGLTLTSATGTNWLCGAVGQTVTCDYQMPPASPPASGEALPDITLTVDVGITAVGVFNNVATVSTPGDTNPANDTAVDQTVVPFTADLSLTKVVSDPLPYVGTAVTFIIAVQNAGPHDATNVIVSDLLPAGLSYVSSTPGQGTYDSGTGQWSAGTINNGASATLDIVATVTTVGANSNQAQVDSFDQTDPDSTPGNSIPSEDDQSSAALSSALFDPPTGTKVLNQQNLPELEWRMVWINPSNTVAVNVQISDPIPAGTTYVAGSLSCAPQGSSSSTTCTFDSLGNRIFWEGVIGPDPGATDEASAANEVIIVFRVTVPNALDQVSNQGTSLTDTDNDGDFADETTPASEADTNIATWNRPRANQLPATGFAPGVETMLPPQPAGLAYSDLPGAWIEIPSLGVEAAIVGVPLLGGSWDVTWLDDQAGYLEGSAFPGWSGNSALTAHNVLPSGLPGPFFHLGQLAWGDRIIVHANGQKSVYEVRSRLYLRPDDLSSALHHEELPWLTLITCQEFDEQTGSYAWRVAVRAVLIEVR